MKNDIIKSLLSGLCGLTAAFFKSYGIILALVCTAVIMDFVTGIVKAKITGEGLKSQKAANGFYKKLTLFLGLFFGIFLDWFIPFALKYVDFSVPFTMPFALIIGCYIIFNESISICENLYQSNPDIMPKAICKMLNVAKSHIDDENSVKK